MISFEESGMKFVFADDDCYCVEHDPLVTKGCDSSSRNLKACECVSVINGRHCFIEAKSSSPRGPNGSVSDVKLNDAPLPDTWRVYDNYRTFLRDISQKFTDSLAIIQAVGAGRHGADRAKTLGKVGGKISWGAVRFILILNIKVAPGKAVEMDGLQNLQDALKGEMRPFLKLWNIPDTAVKVVTPEQAAKVLGVPVAL